MEFFTNYVNVFKKVGDYEGRSSYKEYWRFSIANGVVFIILLSFVAFFLNRGFMAGLAEPTLRPSLWDYFSTPTRISLLALNLYILAILPAALALAVRRLHDVNKSGWWVLINLALVVGTIHYYFLTKGEGDPGPNRYGEPPLVE